MTITKEYNKNNFVSELVQFWDFSYEGAELLFDYLDELGDQVIIFDPVAFRCEYSESNIDELLKNYFDIRDRYLDYTNELNLVDNPENRTSFFNEHIKGDDFYIWGESELCLVIDF